jgi:hypothetical protein
LPDFFLHKVLSFNFIFLFTGLLIWVVPFFLFKIF